MLHIIKNIFLNINLRKFDTFKNKIQFTSKHNNDILNNICFKTQTKILKEEIKKNGVCEELLFKSCLILKKAIKLTLNIDLYDTQIFGGYLLYSNKIIEMKTGEGKTVTATIPIYLNYLCGKNTHIATVNDYLAKRDFLWMEPVYNLLGITSAVLQNNMTQQDRVNAYKASIIYGTSSEFAFDYLRDNIRTELKYCVQKEFNCILIDEIDSILIDEARTPLIISNVSKVKIQDNIYQRINKCVVFFIQEHIKQGRSLYKHMKKIEQVLLTSKGYVYLENILLELKYINTAHDLYTNDKKYLLGYFLNALKAHIILKKNIDYIIKEDKILIIDDNTGRIFFDKRWGNGLHQAVEAKEHTTIKNDTQTISTITLQNYVKLYAKICGMTGTAKTESEEFKEIYNLDVIVIPPHKKCRNINNMDLMYITHEEKTKKIIIDLLFCKFIKRPVLVGTTTIKISEILSILLTQNKLEHNILNARYHEKEACIIKNAGIPSVITVATSMAGRGTDIVLGGSKETHIKKFKNILSNKNTIFVTQQKYLYVLLIGGLYVLGTERYKIRRIDNQLLGRAARQGDPGSTRFYLSLDDKLIKIFIKQNTALMLRNLGLYYGEAITHNIINNIVTKAQKDIEYNNFMIRKNLLEYDTIINTQRTLIYTLRKKILINCNTLIKTDEVLKNKNKLNVSIIKQKQYNYQKIHIFEAKILLCLIDTYWKIHINNTENIRKSVNLQVYANKNPLDYYKKEVHEAFNNMLMAMGKDYTIKLDEMYKILNNT